MTTKAQQPSQAAMGAARELRTDGKSVCQVVNCAVDDCHAVVVDANALAAIIHRHLSAERKEVREVLRWLLHAGGDWRETLSCGGKLYISVNLEFLERAEALLSKMGEL